MNFFEKITGEKAPEEKEGMVVLDLDEVEQVYGSGPGSKDGGCLTQQTEIR